MAQPTTAAAADVEPDAGAEDTVYGDDHVEHVEAEGPGIEQSRAQFERLCTALAGPDGRIRARALPADDEHYNAEKFCGRPAELWPKLKRYNDAGYDIVVAVNDGGHRNKDITSIRANVADSDDPDRTADVLEAAGHRLQPHFTVQSSKGKRHLYWLGDGGQPVDQFSSAQGGINHALGTDPQVSDRARQMRAPGLWSWKRGCMVRIVEDRVDDVPAYSVDRIKAAFPPVERRGGQRQAGPIPDTAGEGERHGLICTTLARLRYLGLDEDELHAAAHAINESRLRPPLPEREVDDLVRWASRQAARGEEFERDKHGAIAAGSQFNVRLAVDQLGVSLSYDTFADRMLVDRGDGPVTLQDEHVTRLWLECDETFGFKPSHAFFRTVIEDYARQASFHPVRRYLDGLEWDGTPRLDRWLADYGGAEDSEYNRAVGSITLIAAVRRVRRPGCKHDEIAVLESDQGLLKSSALSTLCPNADWFSDDLPLDADSQKVIERTAGKWIVEASELAGMRRGQVEQVKAFCSRTRDTARLAYGRIPTERDRQFIVIGTTNSSAYLKDSTGGRRYWPVKVSRFDVETLRRDRDQLWAEAAAREARGESTRLPEHLWGEAQKAQEGRRVRHPWEDVIAGRMGGLDGVITVEDAWSLVGMTDAGRRGQQDATDLGNAMQALGFDRRRRRVDGRLQYVYVRPAADGSEPRIVVACDEHGRAVGVRHAGDSEGAGGEHA